MQSFDRKDKGSRWLGVPVPRWNDYWRDRTSGCGLDSSGSGMVPVTRCCGYGIEPSGFAKLRGID
jgi:hypothetical protein